MNIAGLTVRQSKSSHPWPISWHLYIQSSLQHLPHSRPSRVFREQRISPLIIHCFRWTQWIPIPSYCWAPSSRLIAAPKVINFIPGDVPTNVNDRRRLLTLRLCFNLLAGPSEPLPARGKLRCTLLPFIIRFAPSLCEKHELWLSPQYKGNIHEVHSWRPRSPQGAMATANTEIITWNSSAINEIKYSPMAWTSRA